MNMSGGSTVKFLVGLSCLGPVHSKCGDLKAL